MEHPTANPPQEHNLPVGKSLSASAPKKSSAVGFIWLILAIVALGALTAFGALPRINQRVALEKHTKEQGALAMSVSVVAAQPGAAMQEFSLPGNTEAIQDAPIYARVDGYLHKRYVNIGDSVKAGQVLADIETPELDQQVEAAASSAEQANANLDTSRQAYLKAQVDEKSAAANVQKAKTDLQFYTRELARYRQLVAQGAVSAEDSDARLQAYNAGMANLDSMVAAERSAQVTITSAKAAVHVAQAAANAAQSLHNQYQATQSFKKVTALFDGVVTKRNVDAGALIASGSGNNNNVLFEIAKTDILRVFVYVPEQYVVYIENGEHAILDFQEFPSSHFDGIVSNVSGGIDPQSKTLQVEIHVPNAKHKLLPGMYAQVRFQVPTKVRLPVVPATTCQTRPDGAFMFTVDKENRAHLHKVFVGRDLGGSFEIASGINVGDLVIINPSDEIRDNMEVTPTIVELPKAEKDKK